MVLDENQSQGSVGHPDLSMRNSSAPTVKPVNHTLGRRRGATPGGMRSITMPRQVAPDAAPRSPWAKAKTDRLHSKAA